MNFKTEKRKLHKWMDNLECSILNMYEGDELDRIYHIWYKNYEILNSDFALDPALSGAYQNLLKLETEIKERHEQISRGLEQGRSYYYLVHDEQQEEKPWLIGYVEKCDGFTVMHYVSLPMGPPVQYKTKQKALRDLENNSISLLTDDVLWTNGTASLETRIEFVRSHLAVK